MKFYIPDNIFARLIVNNLPETLRTSIIYQPSSLLTSKLKSAQAAAALIPTLDLIQNKELFVSKSFGISFEGSLCNSYLYFESDQTRISTVNLQGDISSVEAVMCKILFKEIYDTNIEVGLSAGNVNLNENNVLIAGDNNLKNNLLSAGVSFAEEVIETLNLPFVNYILASTDETLLKELNTTIAGIGNKVYENLEESLKQERLDENVKNYIAGNISSLIFDFDGQDVEGIEQIIRLPYYHGLIKDIVEVKFI